MVDMGFHHRLGKFFFEARKAPQKNFFRWWSCTFFSSLVWVYRGTGVSRRVRPTTWERSLKNWELQIPCFVEFSGNGAHWDSSLLVSFTLQDTPVLFTPPLPLPSPSPTESVRVFRGYFLLNWRDFDFFFY